CALVSDSAAQDAKHCLRREQQQARREQAVAPLDLPRRQSTSWSTRASRYRTVAKVNMPHKSFDANLHGEGLQGFDALLVSVEVRSSERSRDEREKNDHGGTHGGYFFLCGCDLLRF